MLVLSCQLVFDLVYTSRTLPVSNPHLAGREYISVCVNTLVCMFEVSGFKGLSGEGDVIQ